MNVILAEKIKLGLLSQEVFTYRNINVLQKKKKKTGVKLLYIFISLRIENKQ